MSPEVYDAALSKWGHIEGPDTSNGPGLWPCFLFGYRSDLLQCGSFISRSWNAGAVIPGLNYECRTEMHTDTMTAAAFLLRDKCRIYPDVQYKELWQKECKGQEPWFHVGGIIE